jgi:rubredoxin
MANALNFDFQPKNASVDNKSFALMEKLKMKFANGDVVEMKVPAAGGSYCPICGEAFFNYVPYEMNNEGIYSGNFDNCPTCSFKFGHADMIGADFPPGALSAVWKEFRRRWLNQKGWTTECVEQMQTNLEIDVAALRQEAGENVSRISYWSKKSKPVAGNKVKFTNGETIDRKALVAGAWICPVCGAKLYSAWLPDVNDLKKFKGRLDTCPSCGYVTEESDPDAGTPPEIKERCREEMRLGWLTKNFWRKECLGQLKNLGIDVAEFKKKHRV